jgi:predicted MarR family transcription regulator
MSTHCPHQLIPGPRPGECYECWHAQLPRRQRASRVQLTELAGPQLTQTAVRMLDAIRQAEPDVPSIRELQATCEISSTSVVSYHLRRLAAAGYLTIGVRGTARSYRLTAQGRGKYSRVEELENALRLMRRWIEAGGDHTMDIYNLTAQLLPY